MAYINQEFQKALNTLQAWSPDISQALAAALEAEDGSQLATYLSQLPEDVLNEIRHCSGLFHAASLAAAALVGVESQTLSTIRRSASDLNHFAGFLLYILDNAEPRKGE